MEMEVKKWDEDENYATIIDGARVVGEDEVNEDLKIDVASGGTPGVAEKAELSNNLGADRGAEAARNNDDDKLKDKIGVGEVRVKNNEDVIRKQGKDRERELKDRRRQIMAGAIADGVSSLANLWFTTKGAPSMWYDGMSVAKKLKDDFKSKDEAWRKAITEQRKLVNKGKGGESRFYLNRERDCSVGLENWQNRDFIDEFFKYLETECFEGDEFKDLRDLINGTRWRKHRVVKNGKWVDEVEDRFAGRKGSYFKRDFLETMMMDGELDEQEREKLENLLEAFEESWIRIKH